MEEVVVGAARMVGAEGEEEAEGEAIVRVVEAAVGPGVLSLADAAGATGGDQPPVWRLAKSSPHSNRSAPRNPTPIAASTAASSFMPLSSRK